jgi:uncharacterized protein YllA (UPF0747 family)
MKTYNLEVKFNIEMTEKKFKEFQKSLKKEIEEQKRYPESLNLLATRGERVINIEYKIISEEK